MNHFKKLFSSHQVLLSFFCICVACIIILRFFPLKASKSNYTGLPSTSFICSSLQMQYSINSTNKITISVSNIGDYTGEFYKPYLEVLKNNTWYIVKDTPQTDQTSNLLYLSPGESQSFDLVLTQYVSHLLPGHYRAVFPLVKDSGFFAYEFELLN